MWLWLNSEGDREGMMLAVVVEKSFPSDGD